MLNLYVSGHGGLSVSFFKIKIFFMPLLEQAAGAARSLVSAVNSVH